jgi:EH domain-containing protein 1
MPVMFWKQSTQHKLIDDLPSIYKLLSSKHSIDPLDLPPIEPMRERLAKLDFATLPKLKEHDISLIDEVINLIIPGIWASLTSSSNSPDQRVVTAELRATSDSIDPRVASWLSTPPNLADFISDFELLGPGPLGKVSGAAVKREFLKSRLPSSSLYKIWKLSDIDGDGSLDLYEYSLARQLIAMCLEGLDLPTQLPQHLLSRK